MLPYLTDGHIQVHSMETNVLSCVSHNDSFSHIFVTMLQLRNGSDYVYLVWKCLKRNLIIIGLYSCIRFTLSF